MPEDLGARLVRAGLASREQLADALAVGPVQGGSLAVRLLDRGVSEDDLVGFFLSDGFGPLLDAQDLFQAKPPVLDRVHAEMAHALMALPIRESAAGLVVAMADPSDAHAVSELRYAIGGSVLPTVARVSDLRNALRRFYPDVAVEERPSDLPLELVRRRTEPRNPVSLNESTGEPEIVLPLVRPKGFTPAQGVARDDIADDEPVQPLVKRKIFGPPKEEKHSVKKVSAKPIVAPKEPDSAPPGSSPLARSAAKFAAAQPANPHSRPAPNPTAPSGSAPEAKKPAKPMPQPKPPKSAAAEPIPLERRSSRPSSPGTTTSISSQPPRSIIPADESSWGDLSEPPTDDPRQSSPPNKLISKPPPKPKPADEPPPPDIGSHLAAIRGASDRDEIVRHACEAALTVARSAVLLALRKGVLRGWDARGPEVSPDAIRNLWIPSTAPSMFKRVLERLEPHRGPYGTSAADNLYRAATGSRGGQVIIQPIMVGDKAVAVLCAEDAGHGPMGFERLEVLAHAVGTAFKRIIVSGKR